jgi:E3 ubiquitin-protein ligase DOA10
MLEQEDSNALRLDRDLSQAYAACRRAAATLPNPTSTSNNAAAETSELGPWRVDDDAKNNADNGADNNADNDTNNDANNNGSAKKGVIVNGSSSANADDMPADAEKHAAALADDADTESAPVVANVHVYAQRGAAQGARARQAAGARRAHGQLAGRRVLLTTPPFLLTAPPLLLTAPPET